jgi:hypothetical protein
MIIGWRDESRSSRVKLGQILTVIAGLSLMSEPASAADKPVPRAELFQKLIDCRAIRDNSERLACFDDQAAKIDAAEAKQDVIVIDRGQATKARKEAFGLPTSKLPVLGVEKGSSPLGEGVNDIQTTLRQASQMKNGKWLFVLADGARWFQTDYDIIRDPKPGQSIRIRKAAIGSYLANIEGRKAIRVKRADQP